MKKNALINIVFCLGYIFAGAILSPATGNDKSPDSDSPGVKPNIIIIISDDQGWRDIGYHGSEIKTPVLDKLAEENIKLNNFYVAPTCSPTRASLLTGKYPSRFPT